MNLTELIPANATDSPDAVYEAFVTWCHSQGIDLYPHQEQAILALASGNNAIVATPTGSGKTLIATAALFYCYATGGRSYYTAPIKALVSEKFFALCDIFGADNVGMVTGDASVNPNAAIVCCTAEILANIALREGREADLDQVVMDEFHFLADPSRGWAWQVPLSELPQAQFVIMSATLGDVTRLTTQITACTGHETTVIADAERPVPLTYEWSDRPFPETIELIISSGKAPVYIVHSTQNSALETALSLQSVVKITVEQRRLISQALADFRFSSGFGKTLSRLVKQGIGVHHAGLLPKYRRMIENLAQQGLLTVICGTDTLGVGINVPIRCVCFTELTKFDGNRRRVLRSREFHQIAGRAGRAGFDTVGYVVAQAPEHAVENAKLAAKAGGDPVKLKRIKKKRPPEGFVNYNEETYTKLIESVPEALYGKIVVTNSLLLNLLSRQEDTASAFIHILDGASLDPKVKRRLMVLAVRMGRALLDSGVVTRLDQPTAEGRRYQLNVDLQNDFALNQPLSAFALAAFDELGAGGIGQTPGVGETPVDTAVEAKDTDPANRASSVDKVGDDSAGHHPASLSALDLVSIIESTLDDPFPVLRAQLSKEKARIAEAARDADLSYEDKRNQMDAATWPMPLADELESIYQRFAHSHPWISDTPLSPKSVIREMFEHGMNFNEYVAFHKVQRAEGTVLRYLSDGYRALRQTVPESLHTTQFEDLLAWLGQIVRMTDSSLIDEWESMVHPTGDEGAAVTVDVPSFTSNLRAFRVLVRNAMFRRVELCANDDPDGLAALAGNDPDPEVTVDDWDDALGRYWDEHEEIYCDSDARGPDFFMIDESVDRYGSRIWKVRQIIDDENGDHDWSLTAEVNLDLCDEKEELVIHDLGLGPSG